MGLSETVSNGIVYPYFVPCDLSVYLIAGEYSCESAVCKPTVRLLCSGIACCDRLFVNKPEL